MDKCLEIYNLLGINHEELENLNRPNNSEEIQTTIKNLPPQKRLGPDGFPS